MSENLERNDVVGIETVKHLHEKMHGILEGALELIPDVGFCVFAFFPAEDGMRIAHMANMENSDLMNIVKAWLIHLEEANGRDRIN